MSCSQEVRQVAAQETVITEKVSRVDCLTIVLAGRWVHHDQLTRPGMSIEKCLLRQYFNRLPLRSLTYY